MKLRVDRNDAVYQAATIEITSITTTFWTTCISKLRAISTREHSQVSSAMRDAKMYDTYRTFHSDEGFARYPAVGTIDYIYYRNNVSDSAIGKLVQSKLKNVIF